MDHTFYPAFQRKDFVELRTDCLCDLCSLKKYQEMENMCIKERSPPFHSPPWLAVQQPLMSPPRFILPKPQPEPSPVSRSCGLAYDHKDLPRLVAVHSLRSAPSYVMHELSKATIYPQRNIGPLLPQVPTKDTTSDETTMSSHTEDKEPDPAESKPERTVAKSPPPVELPPNEKDMGKLLTKIKKIILKIQSLRKSFHEELQNHTKRKILDQLLHEREKLKEMRELLQELAQGGKIHDASEIFSINEENELDSNKFHEVEYLASSPKPSSVSYTASNDNTEGNDTPRVGDEDVGSDISSFEPQSTEISSSEQPANIDAPNSEVYKFNGDNSAVIDKADYEEQFYTPSTGYVRCAGILEQRSEGDNFICDYDEWTMHLYEGTHKAVFKRRGSKRRSYEQDNTEPPEKKSSVESSDEGYEAESSNEMSDVEVFSLETPHSTNSCSPPHRTDSISPPHSTGGSSPPHRNDGSSPPHSTYSTLPPHRNDGNSPPHRTDGSSLTFIDGEESETYHCEEEEVDDTIMKLERRFQIREAKINQLTQKREKLMDELRRVKLSSRDS